MATPDKNKVVPESKLVLEAKKLISGGWGDDLSLRDPEWIILYGKTRTGKSNQGLSFVDAHVEMELDKGTDSDKLPRCYVIDMDRSGRRDLENFPVLYGMELVHHKYCRNVEEVFIATCALVGDESRGIKGLIRPGDWIIVDRATVVWEKIPAYYVETRLKKSLDQLEYEYQLDAADGKVKKGSALLEYYRSGINPLWNAWEQTIRESGAHCIFICTDQELALEATKIRGKDSTEKITNFIAAGVVPRMQGDTWSRWHTQILLERPYAKPRWFAKTMGDRGDRVWLGADERKEIFLDSPRNLGSIYLREVAKWK